MRRIERLAGWLWDQIPNHHQVRWVPDRVFAWFEGHANRRDKC